MSTTYSSKKVNQSAELFDKLLEKAVEQNASDFYLEPVKTGFQVRFRIDGILETVDIVDMAVHQGIIEYLQSKSKSNAKEIGEAKNTASKETRAHFTFGTDEVDVRIAFFPTLYGEAVAMRVLSQEKLLTLPDLGFSDKNLKEILELIKNPSGIFLVTGPTGSGKSSTLRSMLLTLDRHKLHIISVEDPVEFEIEGVSQTQIDVAEGNSFASVLKSILRQDPDLIMIGEIRDQETAEMAFRYALTGRMVLSTLHTNGAVETITRLTDLGVDPKLIASALRGALAQRLVRRLCQACKVSLPMTAEDVKALGIKSAVPAFGPKGCDKCNNRGYKGRIGIFELIIINDEFRSLIGGKAPEVRLQEKAISSHMNSLMQDAIEKIKQGFVSVDEVIKILGKV